MSDRMVVMYRFLLRIPVSKSFAYSNMSDTCGTVWIEVVDR